jgi:predicted acylesterase/phospholipase RssA
MTTAQTTDWWSQPSRKGVLVSGGAPNLHLAAGALCAFYEHGVSFDIVGAAGAGALPGLLYAVPKNRDRVASLQSTVYINVHDVIYSLIPNNFKLFYKRGPLTEAFWRLGRRLPRFPLTADDRYQSSGRRLYNDWLDLVVAGLTPPGLGYWSPSVCTRVGVIDDIVDWPGLQSYPKKFYLNTFDLGTQTLRLFDKTNLSPEAFYAALAMPWLYEPTRVEDTIYTEGAAHDPSALDALWDAVGPVGQPEVDMLIALDTVVPDLWLEPANIQEALELAVMDPILCLSEYVLALYAWREVTLNQSSLQVPRIYHVPFPIAAADASRILDWSYSNAMSLWQIGHTAAEEFCAALQSSNPNDLEKYRYYHVRKDRPLISDFLKLFDAVPPS